MNLAEQMPNLMPLIQRAAVIRNDAEAANPAKREHEIRYHLMETAEYAEAHAAIASILAEDERFRQRHGSLVLHGAWASFTQDSVAHWLATRGNAVTPDQACADVLRFLSANEFPYTVRVAVSGIFTDHDVDFGSGVWLRARGREHLPEQLKPKGFLRSLLHMPMVTLVEDRHQRIVKRPEDDSDDSKFLRARLEADDVLLCLSLVGLPAVPFLVGLACQPAEWVPLYGYVDLPRSLESSGHQKRYFRNQTQRAQMIFDSFRSLSSRGKDKLRLPMRRLNTALRRRDDADTAIDLGIALESLVLGRVETDKRYQAGIRCAFLLGGDDADSRHRVYHLASELYHLRNRGVHRGALTNDDLNSHFKGREVRSVLEEGSQLVAKVIELSIENKAQEPDWNSLVLGPRSGVPIVEAEPPEF